MPTPPEPRQPARFSRLISLPILVLGLLVLIVVGPAIARLPRLIYGPPVAPGFIVSDGSSVVCTGRMIAVGDPFVWCIDRKVVWTIDPPPTPHPRPLTDAARKAEYVALRTAHLDPKRDAGELLFLAHPVTGSEILWGPAALNLLCALALLVAIDRVYRRIRAFVASRHPKPGVCRKCGFNLTGNVSGVCPECGRKVDASALEGPPAD